MALKLPHTVYSQDQVLAAAEELKHYASAMAAKRRAGTKTDLPELSEQAADIVDTLAKTERSSDTVITEICDQMEEMAVQAPVVNVILAGVPPPNLKEEIVTWMRTQLGARLLVNFHVDSNIAGGIVIRTPNHIYDCSFRTLLLEKKSSFVEVLSRV